MGPGWGFGIISRLDQVGRNLLIITRGGKPTLLIQKGKDIYQGPDRLKAVQLKDQWIVTSSENTTSSYDQAGKETSRKDANGNTMYFEYDTQERISKITAVAGRPITFSYGDNGRLHSIQDWTGRQSRYRYNAEGCLAAVQDADGWKTDYVYGEKNEIAAVGYPDGVKVQFRYDANGKVAERISSAGDRYTYSYESATRITRQDGFWWEMTYDRQGKPLTYLDRLKREQRWYWNDANQLTKKRFSDGSNKTYTYDLQGRMIKEQTGQGDLLEISYQGETQRPARIIRNGAVTKFDYDPSGNLLSITSPAGRKTTYQYDGQGRRISVTDGEGRTTRFEYDAVGNMVKQINPDNGVIVSQYDENGRLTRRFDPLGNPSIFTYDPNGMPSSATAPDGTQIGFKHDRFGRLVEKTVGPHSVRYSYDPGGNLVKIDYPNGTCEQFSYNVLGIPFQSTDILGRVTRNEFDSLGRLIKAETPSGPMMRNTFSGTGKLESVALDDRVVRIASDNGGRLLRLTDSSGDVYLLVRDQLGRVVQRVFPGGGKEQRQYDADGLLKAVTLPMGDTWRFSHNRAGQLEEILFPDQGVRKLSYDGAGRLSSIVFPSGEKVVYRYGPTGLLLESTNARGGKIKYHYDKSGRVIEKKLPNTIWNYRYNAMGKLIQADNGLFTIRYTYDRLGQLLKTEYPQWGKAVQYEYDKFGRMITLIDPEGNRTWYFYDTKGRISGITAGQGIQFLFRYDDKGRLIRQEAENGSTVEYSYDDSDRIHSVVHRNRKGKLLSASTCRYDPDGNRIEVKDQTNKKRVYRYDQECRLIGESGKLGQKNYGYGPGGKRSSASDNAGSVTYSYDRAGRLVKAGDVSFSYDADGNLITRRTKEGLTRYSYDSENNLIQVELPDKRIVSYGYGPFKERIWREENGSRIYYLLHGDNLFQELSEDYRTLTTYIHLGLDRPLVSFSKKHPPYFYHQDDLGSILAVSNADGETIARYAYDAFGNIMQQEGKDPDCRFRFTGRPLDSATGLYDLRARFYDPEIGQFITRDPRFGVITEPATLSTYQYALNNPLGFVDPYGTHNIGTININNALYFGRAPVRVEGMSDVAEVYTDIADQIYDRGIRRPPPPGVQPVNIPASGLERVGGGAHVESVSAGGQTVMAPGQTGSGTGRTSDRIGGATVIDSPQVGSGRSVGRSNWQWLRSEWDLWQETGPSVQRVGYVAGMGNLSMALADIAAEPVSAMVYGEDASMEMDVAAQKMTGLAIGSAAMGLATHATGTLLLAAAPAAAPVLLTGGAVVSTAALAYGAGNRVGRAFRERQSLRHAEMEEMTALRHCKNQELLLSENRLEIVGALEKKFSEMKTLIGKDLNEVATLELEVANRRAQISTERDRSENLSDLKGIDERITIMEYRVGHWRRAREMYDSLRRSLTTLRNFDGIAEDLDSLDQAVNTMTLPDVETADDLLADAKRTRADIEESISEEEDHKGGGFEVLGYEDKESPGSDSGGFQMLGQSEPEEPLAGTEKGPEKGTDQDDFAAPGSSEAHRAIETTENVLRPKGEQLAAELDALSDDLEKTLAKNRAEAKQFLREGLEASGKIAGDMISSNIKPKSDQTPPKPELPYKLDPVGPNWNPVDEWGAPGKVPSGVIKCPKDKSEFQKKCASVNSYIREHGSKGDISEIWRANLQRAYLFRAQCCGYRWTTEGSGDDAGSHENGGKSLEECIRKYCGRECGGSIALGPTLESPDAKCEECKRIKKAAIDKCFNGSGYYAKDHFKAEYYVLQYYRYDEEKQIWEGQDRYGVVDGKELNSLKKSKPSGYRIIYGPAYWDQCEKRREDLEKQSE